MKSYYHKMTSTREAGDLLERLFEIATIILLALMPLAFGTVHAWSEQIVLLSAEQGVYTEAEHEARICLDINTDYESVKTVYRRSKRTASSCRD